MKERILRVLMIFAYIFAIGFTIFIAAVDTRHTLLAAAIGTGVFAAAITVQYILLGKWHPMHLFSNNEQD